MIQRVRERDLVNLCKSRIGVCVFSPFPSSHLINFLPPFSSLSSPPFLFNLMFCCSSYILLFLLAIFYNPCPEYELLISPSIVLPHAFILPASYYFFVLDSWIISSDIFSSSLLFSPSLWFDYSSFQFPFSCLTFILSCGDAEMSMCVYVHTYASPAILSCSTHFRLTFFFFKLCSQEGSSNPKNYVKVAWGKEFPWKSRKTEKERAHGPGFLAWKAQVNHLRLEQCKYLSVRMNVWNYVLIE